MKIFCNGLRFLAVATGAVHLIFAVDSNSIATDQSASDKGATTITPVKGRASYVWEKRINAPYAYQRYHQYKPMVTSPVYSSNMYPRIDYLKSNFRPTVNARIASVAGADDQRSERHGSAEKSYGSSGGATKAQYYPAQPLPYYPPTKEHGSSFGSFGFFKPLFFVLILPFFLLLFFVTVVFVVRVAAASSSATAVGLTQQQQQQQESNNNNNNDNNNNDNNNNAIVLSTGTGTTFVITINATGRANGDRWSNMFKNPAPLFDWHNSYRALPSMMLNETLLLS